MAYTTGITIRKLISMERLAALLSQNSASTVKLATGTLFIVRINGCSSTRTKAQAAERHASASPPNRPRKKPARMRAVLWHTVCQKAAVGTRPASVFSTASGEARISEEATAMLTACHTHSQNTMASVFCSHL